MLRPQHRIDPSDITAHVWEVPAEIAVAVEMPETITGTGLLAELLLPRRPMLLLFPQQLTDPSASSAHVWEVPAEIEVAVEIPETVTGVGLFV